MGEKDVRDLVFDGAPAAHHLGAPLGHQLILSRVVEETGRLFRF